MRMHAAAGRDARGIGKIRACAPARRRLRRRHPAGEQRRHGRRAESAIFRFGERLIEAAASRGARPILFVGWNYGPSEFRDLPPGARTAYDRRIQSDHLRLARRGDARRANVGRAWQRAQAADPPFRLERDGNIRPCTGSYLAALVIYAQLTGGDVARALVPRRLPAQDARELRRLVDEAPRSGGGGSDSAIRAGRA